MRQFVNLFALLSCIPGLAAASPEQIAFLRNDGVFVADLDGGNARRIDNDARPKFGLRRDPYHNRLSYRVKSVAGEKARVVVIDLTGKALAEVALRPITDPPTSTRFIEGDGISWLPNGKIRVEASVNPMICELFDVDLETGQESNWHVGICGAFAPSPDGKHIIERHPTTYPAPDEERFDVLETGPSLVDFSRPGPPPFYRGDDPRGIFILAGPVWSPDSQKIAFIEKAASTGQAALVILSLDKAVTRIPVPAAVLEQPAVAWVGTKVVVGEGSDAMQVDSSTKSIGPATFDVTDVLERSAKARKAAEAKAKRIEEVVRNVGGRDGVALE